MPLFENFFYVIIWFKTFLRKSAKSAGTKHYERSEYKKLAKYIQNLIQNGRFSSFSVRPITLLSQLGQMFLEQKLYLAISLLIDTYLSLISQPNKIEHRC